MGLERIPYLIHFADTGPTKDTYGGAAGSVFVECLLARPGGTSARTLVVFSHPVGGGAFLPVVTGLARAGHHVLFVHGRYRGNDSALVLERCVTDLGAAIRDARARFGYERVVLAGWSGGGSLSLLYQEQAERPSLTATPAGDPIDMRAAELVPAECVLLIAAHVSRAVTLTESLDPSITDEARPDRRSPELDLYGGSAPAPPYDAAFLQRYRQAQIDRNHRITRWVRDELARARTLGAWADRCFVVHGTNADPRWLDPTVDPNGRPPGVCWLGDPRAANDGPIGLARFCTLRSWLSQWSLSDSHAHGERNAARVNAPVLVIENGADEVCTPSHARRLFDAVAHDDKRHVRIEGATHYYAGQPEQLAQCVGECTRWLEEHGLAG